MSYHLPPSRRQFIVQSLGAGALLLVDQTAAAEPADRDPQAFALLADTHIGANPKHAMHGVTLVENLNHAIDGVLNWKARPAAVLINGDCARIEGLIGDYKTLATTLEPLSKAGLSIHMTMGNHDDRKNFYEVLKTKPASAPVEGKFLVIRETPDANWFMLDSLFKVNKVTGAFGEQQLRWLDEALRARADKPAILVGHHYPQKVRDPNKTVTGLKDTEAFTEIINRHQQVSAYIYGHSHNWQVRTDSTGVHYINLPPVAYVFNKARPNGWVKARTSASHLDLELVAFDSKHPENGQSHHLPFRMI